MLLNIATARQNIGKTFHFDGVIPKDNSLLSDRGYLFLSDISVEGEYYYKDDMIFLTCHAQYTIKGLCDNCSEEIEKNISFDFEENFVESTVSSDIDNYVINGFSIDIDKCVYDNLLYHLPTRLLCTENCLGLCMVCGKNKNLYTCNCENIQDEELSQEQNPFSKIKLIGDK